MLETTKLRLKDAQNLNLNDVGEKQVDNDKKKLKFFTMYRSKWIVDKMED